MTLNSNQPGEDATVATIITLNSSPLVIEITESESEDFDEDGNDEELIIVIELTFAKQ